MNYDVTIGIPVHNALKSLYKTMISALAQDYSSIEFLILDDCGTDGSIDIIRQLQKNHERGADIRIVSHTCNRGIGVARNRIIDEAKGEFLFFLDADDFIIPTTISMMVNAARMYEAELVMASYEKIEVNKGGKKTVVKYHDRVFTREDEFATNAFSRYGSMQAHIWNLLMRLDFVRNIPLQFLPANFWEDLVFKYELATYVVRVVQLSDITYSYIYCDREPHPESGQTIKKEEVIGNAATIGALKSSSSRLKNKKYFSKWLYCVLMTDFYIICNALKNSKQIYPPIGDGELIEFMISPLSLKETVLRGNVRLILLWVLSKLPPVISLYFIKIVGKYKKLI